MRRLLLCLMPLALFLNGCTMGYDAFSTASLPKTRFSDTKPQDFGRDHPDRHPIHGIDISKYQGDIDWQAVTLYNLYFARQRARDARTTR